ncbi:hypothetical protein [Defluviimonas sp. SAOS-178_SWC]|uniref:hypothetical protein n=1 Tax=Defluviimonas sp. SAOS-178_SWC TaxID=3121287 RepID=UPI003221F009
MIKEGEADQKTVRGIVFSLTVKRFHHESHGQPRNRRILPRAGGTSGLRSQPMPDGAGDQTG